MKKKDEQFRSKHPYGTSLLSRDTPQNQKIWGPSGAIGYADVDGTVCTSDNQCPHYKHTEDASRPKATETPIHILIAAFRDRLCSRTLFNIFDRAENPHRIFVRVIDQTEPDSDLIDDAGCWERYCDEYNSNCEEYKDHVAIYAMNSQNSKGPTDARSKLSAWISWDYQHRDDAQQLSYHPVGLNDFCMQIDSHMDFSDNFDTELIFAHHRTENDYAVLSTYVADIEQNNKDPKVVPNLCMVTFTRTIRNWGTKECVQLVKPKLTNAMWGAGLSFHRCHAEINVPADPYLDYVFDGEEGSRGIRFFTHGYDVYTPDRVLVTHDYHTHQGNPVVHTWGQKRGEERKKKYLRDNKHADNVELKIEPWMEQMESHRHEIITNGTDRVNLLLGIGSHKKFSSEQLQEVHRIRASRYGLGTKRDLAKVKEFTGIDLRNRQMLVNKCGNNYWVPYEESPDYGVEDFYQRGFTGSIDSLSAGDKKVVLTPTNHSLPQTIFQPRNMLVEEKQPAAPAVDTTSLQVRRLGQFLSVLCTILLYITFRSRETKDVKHKN